MESVLTVAPGNCTVYAYLFFFEKSWSDRGSNPRRSFHSKLGSVSTFRVHHTYLALILGTLEVLLGRKKHEL